MSPECRATPPPDLVEKMHGTGCRPPLPPPTMLAECDPAKRIDILGNRSETVLDITSQRRPHKRIKRTSQPTIEVTKMLPTVKHLQVRDAGP